MSSYSRVAASPLTVRFHVGEPGASRLGRYGEREVDQMQALILAAGRGSRLGGTVDGTPKTLLQIGQRHLIEHQLETLAEAGVGPVHLVVGYGAEEVREIVGSRAEFVRQFRSQLPRFFGAMGFHYSHGFPAD